MPPLQPRGIQPRGRHLRGQQPRGIQPRGSDGDGDDLPALLAEAQLYVDARRLSGTGINEGTGGHGMDATTAIYVDGTTEKAAVFGGFDGEAATCPDAAAIDLTGDWCMALDFDVDVTPAVPCEFMAKPLSGTDDCFAFGLGTTGYPFIEFTRSGEVAHEAFGFLTGEGATEDVTLTAGRQQLVVEFDADNGAGGWTANLYSGTPGSTTLLSSIVNTTDGAVTLETSSGLLKVGVPLYGAMYRARLYSGRLASPTLLRDFHPDAVWTSGATMTAATSEVWSNVNVIDAEAFAYASIPDHVALTVAADADATFAFWFTQNNVAGTDGELFSLVDWYTGTFGVNDLGVRLVDIKITAFGADFSGAFVGDGTDQGFVVGAHWAAGAHLAVLVINRTTDVATLYLDGVSHATANIAAVGAIDPASALTLGAAGHHAVAKWDTTEVPAEIATALGQAA